MQLFVSSLFVRIGASYQGMVICYRGSYSLLVLLYKDFSAAGADFETIGSIVEHACRHDTYIRCTLPQIMGQFGQVLKVFVIEWIPT
jgi:hypothetical protein